MNNQEVRIPSDNPNVTMIISGKDSDFKFYRETRFSTGPIPNPDDASETIEEVTITRRLLNSIND